MCLQSTPSPYLERSAEFSETTCPAAAGTLWTEISVDSLYMKDINSYTYIRLILREEKVIHVFT